MTNKHFNDFLFFAQAHTKELLCNKGTEYNRLEDDRLGTFKRVAEFANIPIETAWFGMVVKHMASVATMCNDDATYAPAAWKEKLNDIIAYCYLMLAIQDEKDDGYDSLLFDDSNSGGKENGSNESI